MSAEIVTNAIYDPAGTNPPTFTLSNDDLLATSLSSSNGSAAFDGGGNIGTVLSDGGWGAWQDHLVTSIGFTTGNFVEFHLDTSVNTGGYDLTSIVVSAWWSTAGNPPGRTEHYYAIEISYVGDENFVELAPLTHYTPGNLAWVSQVTLSENGGGVLSGTNPASGVDAIRFAFTGNPVSGEGANGQNFIREIDVIGVPNSIGGGDPLGLQVVSDGSDLVFTWNSQVGKRYDLLSSIDPEADGDPATWPEVAGSQDLLTDTLTIVRPADGVRFYVVREEDVPPPEPVVVFSDDFESVLDPDWTTGANLGDGDNTIWERGAPVADLGGGAMGPATGANGTTNCYGTNIDATYGADTDIYLRSPPINLTNLTGGNTATLTLQYFIDTDLANPNPDMGSIRVLNANNLGEQLGADLTGSEGLEGLGSDGWTPFSELLPAEALGETIVLEFQFTSNGDAQNFGGFYIDEVAVTTE